MTVIETIFIRRNPALNNLMGTNNSCKFRIHLFGTAVSIHEHINKYQFKYQSSSLNTPVTGLSFQTLLYNNSKRQVKFSPLYKLK